MVKYAFIEVRSKEKIVFPQSFVKKLPQHIALFTTIQYIHQIEELKQQLEVAKKHVILVRTKHTQHAGQLLGCNIDKFQQEHIDAYVYVGDGEFHPKALMYKNQKDVYVFNPHNAKEYLVCAKDVEHLRKQYMASVGAFHMAKNIGVLVVTKPGQNQYALAQRLEEKYPDKHFYILLANTVDFSSLEDFSFIDVFVNTACPRIAYDDAVKIHKPIVNIGDIFMTHLGWQEYETKNPEKTP